MDSKDKGIHIGYSTEEASAIAFTYSDSIIIYWNPVHIYETLKKLVASLLDNSFINFKTAVSELLDTLAHEFVHLDEGRCSGTHNQSFYRKQQTIIAEFFTHSISGDTDKKAFTFENLFEEYKAWAIKHISAATSLDAMEFVQQQLEPTLEISAPTI